jgi:hypothetical protein
MKATILSVSSESPCQSLATIRHKNKQNPEENIFFYGTFHNERRLFCICRGNLFSITGDARVWPDATFDKWNDVKISGIIEIESDTEITLKIRV